MPPVAPAVSLVTRESVEPPPGVKEANLSRDAPKNKAPHVHTHRREFSGSEPASPPSIGGDAAAAVGKYVVLGATCYCRLLTGYGVQAALPGDGRCFSCENHSHHGVLCLYC